MGDGTQRDRVERILEGLERRYATTTPYRQDRELAPELALEARPVVESLLIAAEADPHERARVLDHHEGLAMVTLLGRRAGMLGATPTAALGLVRALFASFEEVGCPVPAELYDDLVALCMEGFVAGREERLLDRTETVASEAQPIVRIADRVLLLFLCGTHPAERIEQVVDRFGRVMLQLEARAGLVDLSRLSDPTPDRAAEVFAAHSAARMLGADCIFTGVSDAWLGAAKEGRVDTELLAIEPSFEDALRRALAIGGWELRRTSWLPSPLRFLKR